LGRPRSDNSSPLSPHTAADAVERHRLQAGNGLDWFWATFSKDHLNRKATDLLN